MSYYIYLIFVADKKMKQLEYEYEEVAKYLICEDSDRDTTPFFALGNS